MTDADRIKELEDRIARLEIFISRTDDSWESSEEALESGDLSERIIEVVEEKFFVNVSAHLSRSD